MKTVRSVVVARLLAVIVAASPLLASAQLMPPPRLAHPADDALVPMAAPCSARFDTWLPTKMSQEITDCFWQDRASFLNMVVVSGWSDRGSIYSELASAAYVGFRFGFSALVAASTASSSTGSTTETNQETAAQRFFAGGGNAILSLAYPLLYAQAGKEPGTYATLVFYPKAATDLPGLGGPAERAPLNLDTSLELQVRLDRPDADLGLFLSGRGGWVFGNDLFYDGLGIARSPFWFSSGTAGVTLSHKIQIAAQFVIYAERDLKDKLPSTTINVSLVSTKGK
jgi:hypothetical protein